ncbi:MAG: ABC transporter ATP-binding protein [Candidatus Lokiarchaeota archaeon]|nr:ABC transporter ATP-binding protein [Candidatus Lokiarchaeota archaeon]
MTLNKKNLISEPLVEFSPGKDSYIKARKKGASRWILAHLFHGSNKVFISVIILTIILAANISSIVYIIIGQAVSALLLGLINSLGNYIAVIFILGIIGPVLRIFSRMMVEILAQRIERDARKEFFSNLLGKSQSFHDRQKIGELMARVTDDVRMLNFLISPALSLIVESFTFLFIPLIYITLFYPFQLIIEPIFFSVSFLILLRTYSRKIGPVTAKLRGSAGNMNATLNETLSGIEVVKATVQENKEMKKYFESAKNYKDAYIARGKLQAKYLPILVLGLIITVGFAHSVVLFNFGIMNIGEIIAYLGILGLLRFPTNISMFVFGIIRLAGSSAIRLLELMNKKTEIDENIEGKSKLFKGDIAFENVNFTYPDSKSPVLNNISFEVKAGQTVAIVGTTGSGKTTLTKLISRLYDVSNGRILVDGSDIKNYALQSLRDQISYIEQDVFLFSTSIFENISFGRVSSIEQVVNVAKQAQAHDFISELAEEYQSEVGERGVQLSGGERQRIAIARAFLSDPKILILDDSTSAIDSNTEDKIQYAIKNILKNRTTFLITHRLSQIRWADLIIVLKNGGIAAKGTHEDLIKTSSEYRKIFVKKFDIEEEQLLKEVRT